MMTQMKLHSGDSSFHSAKHYTLGCGPREHAKAQWWHISSRNAIIKTYGEKYDLFLIF